MQKDKKKLRPHVNLIVVMLWVMSTVYLISAGVLVLLGIWIVKLLFCKWLFSNQGIV